MYVCVRERQYVSERDREREGGGGAVRDRITFLSYARKGADGCACSKVLVLKSASL